MKRSNRITRLVKSLTLLLFISLIVLAGCTKAPTYEVDSLEALKREFAENPKMLFPDIEQFDSFSIDYSANYGFVDSGFLGCSKRLLTSYSISGIEQEGNDLALMIFDSGCTDQERFSSSSPAEQRPLEPNMEYRGIAFADVSHEASAEFYEQFSYHGEKLPAGSYLYFYSYGFELQGCQYDIHGTLVMLPDELEHKDAAAERECGEKELFVLIDSIIDQEQERTD